VSNLFWQQKIPFTWSQYTGHGGRDWSTWFRLGTCSWHHLHKALEFSNMNLEYSHKNYQLKCLRMRELKTLRTCIVLTPKFVRTLKLSPMFLRATCVSNTFSMIWFFTGMKYQEKKQQLHHKISKEMCSIYLIQAIEINSSRCSPSS
jgi:hypothetical protein